MRALKSLRLRLLLASASEASKAAAGDVVAASAALRAVAALRAATLGLVDLARRLAAAPVVAPPVVAPSDVPSDMGEESEPDCGRQHGAGKKQRAASVLALRTWRIFFN